LEESISCYKHWGAGQKVKNLEDTYPDLLNILEKQPRQMPTQSPVMSDIYKSPEALDLTAIMRASQAISSEIDFEILNIQLVQVAISLENARLYTKLKLDITRRKKAEEALIKNEEILRLTLDSTSDGTWNWNVVTGEVVFSDKWLGSLGYKRGEVKPHVSFWESIIHPDDMANTMNTLNLHLEAKTDTYECETRLLKKSGVYRWNLDRGRVIERDDDGKPLRMVGTDTDITERKKAEIQIKSSLREKETLIQEVYHRTKNNMNVICSLLRMQSEGIKDGKVLTMFKDIDSKIRSMSLVHSKLYQAKDLSSINLKDYIADLVSNLFMTYLLTPHKISLKLIADDVPLSLDYAIPCGLAINEIITNSLKYAFPDNRKGEIKITLRRIADIACLPARQGLQNADYEQSFELPKSEIRNLKSEVIELKIADNGIGMPEGFDIKNTDTLGSKLVFGLIEKQLDGKIDLNCENGVEFIIKFNVGCYRKRV